MLLDTDQPFDRPWDIRTIVHGHDGYLDIAVVMGIPALCVAVYAFLIAPLRDYRARSRCSRRTSSSATSS